MTWTVVSQSPLPPTSPLYPSFPPSPPLPVLIMHVMQIWPLSLLATRLPLLCVILDHLSGHCHYKEPLTPSPSSGSPHLWGCQSTPPQPPVDRIHLQFLPSWRALTHWPRLPFWQAWFGSLHIWASHLAPAHDCAGCFMDIINITSLIWFRLGSQWLTQANLPFNTWLSIQREQRKYCYWKRHSREGLGGACLCNLKVYCCLQVWQDLRIPRNWVQLWAKRFQEMFQPCLVGVATKELQMSCCSVLSWVSPPLLGVWNGTKSITSFIWMGKRTKHTIYRQFIRGKEIALTFNTDF